MFFDWLKILPHYLLPKQALTHFAGFVAQITNPRIKNYIIRRFIHKYGVNMKEALIEDPTQYLHFNDFFIRKLKPECRPLESAEVLSPVDGCISKIGTIVDGQLVQAKGRYYTVEELLACDKTEAQPYIKGKFATLYLSPKDYHRVHMPMKGILKSMNYIPGSLFSVQPRTARTIAKLFARNERLAVFFETPTGPMAMVLVGATIVGSIETPWHGSLKRIKQKKHFDYTQSPIQSLAQAEEMGLFKLGSTVILLFGEETHVHWNSSLKAGDQVRFGQALGKIVNTP